MNILKWLVSPKGVVLILAIVTVSGMLFFGLWPYAILTAIIYSIMIFGGTWAKTWKDRV